MSDKSLVRRSAAQVFFGGINVTSHINKYLLSLTYTDNEEDETDDLQIKLHDRDDIWLEKWLNKAIKGALKNKTPEDTYSVTAKSGLSVRSEANDKSKKLGTLAYKSTVTVKGNSGSWAKILYSGETAYVNKQYLKKVILSDYSSADSKLSVGDEVTVTGTPKKSSTGSGNAGAKVTNYKGKITQLNQKVGIPYPVHVGYLGWFSESQVKKIGGKSVKHTEGVASKGLKIQADIIRENWDGNGKDEILECGQFDLDAITASGPPNTITIKGTSLPYSSSVRQTKKSKSWENYSLSGIVAEIADKNDMAYMFISDEDPHYKRVEQYRKSDIAFIQKLCHDAGCSLKVTNNIIVVFDQAKNDKKSAVKTIKKGDKNDYISYTLRTGTDDTYTSCKVIYKNISATAYVEDYDKDKKDNQCLKIHQRVSSVAEAKRLAEKMLKMHNKFELTASFTFPGDTKLLAGCVVKLDKFGPWDGRYVIKQAKHTLSASGYTTQITLRKVVS